MTTKEKRLLLFILLWELCWISIVILLRQPLGNSLYLAIGLLIWSLLLLWRHFKILPVKRQKLSGEKRLLSVISTLILFFSMSRFGMKPTPGMFYFLIFYGTLFFALDWRRDFQYLKNLENKGIEQ